MSLSESVPLLLLLLLWPPLVLSDLPARRPSKERAEQHEATLFSLHQKESLQRKSFMAFRLATASTRRIFTPRPFLSNTNTPRLFHSTAIKMGVTEIKSFEQFKEVINGSKPVVVDFWATWCKCGGCLGNLPQNQR